MGSFGLKSLEPKVIILCKLTENMGEKDLLKKNFGFFLKFFWGFSVFFGFLFFFGVFSVFFWVVN